MDNYLFRIIGCFFNKLQIKPNFTCYRQTFANAAVLRPLIYNSGIKDFSISDMAHSLWIQGGSAPDGQNICSPKDKTVKPLKNSGLQINLPICSEEYIQTKWITIILNNAYQKIKRGVGTIYQLLNDIYIEIVFFKWYNLIRSFEALFQPFILIISGG